MYGYDPYIRDYDPRYDDEETQRLRLMAFVDGRLVSTWTERVEESAWADIARRFDRERERQVLPPRRHPCRRTSACWPGSTTSAATARRCSRSRRTLLEDEPDLPEVDTPQARARLTAVAELLDAVAASSFDPEIAVAFRRCLLAVWDKEPEVVLDAATAAHVAGGVAWVVAKANGVLGAQGRVTVTQLKHALALQPVAVDVRQGRAACPRRLPRLRLRAHRPDLRDAGPAAARPDRICCVGVDAPDPVPRPRPGARGAGGHGGVSSTVDGRIPGMPTLNIKDPEVYQLASELARRRDTSMTGAVRDALTEALERTRLTPEEKVRRMTEIARAGGDRRHRS